MAELSQAGTIIVGALGGIADALLGGAAQTPVTPVAAAEQKIDTRSIMLIGGVALAAVVGIVLLTK